MPLHISSPTKENPNMVIKIKGRFDYSLHTDFRDSYTKSSTVANSYQIDLAETEYMDSSALGMLLLLKEYADASSAPVSLLSPSPAVRKVLDIANFGTFFSIQ